MKQIAIRKHYSYFLTDSNEIEGNVIDAEMDQFDVELRVLLEKYNLALIHHETRFIPMDKMSVCHCSKCNNWMINRDKNPTGFDERETFNDLEYVIYDGGTYEDKELCEECLPISHRWGHFS